MSNSKENTSVKYTLETPEEKIRFGKRLVAKMIFNAVLGQINQRHALL